MILGLPIYFYYQHKTKFHDFKKHWISGIWLLCFLIAMAIISAIGTKELLPAIFVLGLGGQLYRQHSGSDS